MSLPNFLGIGAPRAGTTWLHELLASHPQVYVPSRRKEVRFFDDYYSRGLDWYAGFFPRDALAARYLAIGEITPHYLYPAECPERIAGLPSVTRLLLILRDPVARAYSHYCHSVRIDNYRGTFESFLQQEPHALHAGFYARHLQRYLQCFRREQFLILTHERALADVAATKQSLAAFLRVPATGFPPQAGLERVNAGSTPRARRLYALLARLTRRLQRWDLDWVSNLGKRLGVKQLFGEAPSPPPMLPQTRANLRDLYAPDIAELQAMFGLDLSIWGR